MQLTELGLGCAAMAGNHRVVAEEDNRAAIDEGLNAGIAYVDTAPFYGFGRSEHYVGDALRSRHNCVQSSKAGRLLKPGDAPADEAVDWRQGQTNQRRL